MSTGMSLWLVAWIKDDKGGFAGQEVLHMPWK